MAIITPPATEGIRAAISKKNKESENIVFSKIAKVITITNTKITVTLWPASLAIKSFMVYPSTIFR